MSYLGYFYTVVLCIITLPMIFATTNVFYFNQKEFMFFEFIIQNSNYVYKELMLEDLSFKFNLNLHKIILTQKMYKDICGWKNICYRIEYLIESVILLYITTRYISLILFSHLELSLIFPHLQHVYNIKRLIWYTSTVKEFYFII